LVVVVLIGEYQLEKEPGARVGGRVGQLLVTIEHIALVPDVRGESVTDGCPPLVGLGHSILPMSCISRCYPALRLTTGRARGSLQSGIASTLTRLRNFFPCFLIAGFRFAVAPS